MFHEQKTSEAKALTVVVAPLRSSSPTTVACEDLGLFVETRDCPTPKCGPEDCPTPECSPEDCPTPKCGQVDFRSQEHFDCDEEQDFYVSCSRRSCLTPKCEKERDCPTPKC